MSCLTPIMGVIHYLTQQNTHVIRKCQFQERFNVFFFCVDITDIYSSKLVILVNFTKQKTGNFVFIFRFIIF